MTINERILTLIGGAAVAGSVYLYTRLKKAEDKVTKAVEEMKSVSDKVGLSVDELSKKTTVDIETALVDKAVQQAVDREVGRHITAASDIAVRDISQDMKVQIRTKVTGVYDNLETKVSDELARQVSELDTKQLEADVIAKAEAAVVKKFDGQLDKVLSGFRHDLDNTSKIYGHIASSLIKDRSIPGFSIKLGS